MHFETDGEYLLWAKQKFYEMGISPSEFKKCKVRDIRDVLEISSEIGLKRKREQEVQEIMNNLK